MQTNSDMCHDPNFHVAVSATFFEVSSKLILTLQTSRTYKLTNQLYYAHLEHLGTCSGPPRSLLVRSMTITLAKHFGQERQSSILRFNAVRNRKPCLEIHIYDSRQKLALRTIALQTKQNASPRSVIEAIGHEGSEVGRPSGLDCISTCKANQKGLALSPLSYLGTTFLMLSKNLASYIRRKRRYKEQLQVFVIDLVDAQTRALESQSQSSFFIVRQKHN